jgi:xylono-1,5-lactonase
MQDEDACVKHEVRLIWDVGAELGEGPAWFADEGALRFVDIKGGRLHRYDPATDERETLAIGGMPSFVLPTGGGGMVIGSRKHILPVSRTGEVGPPLAELAMPEHNRTNDAAVDSHGRLWLGTMDDEEQQPTGALWCLTGGVLRHMGGEAVVTNGPAIIPDGRTLYHVDSGARTIWRFTIGEGPTVEDREVFLQLCEADGHPDGVVLDSEQCLWVALWDGWGLRRYSPEGQLLLTVDLPCARVTKLAFGGPDLMTAYVTTARTGLNPAELARQPLAGALFAFDAPAAGLRLPAFVNAVAQSRSTWSRPGIP